MATTNKPSKHCSAWIIIIFFSVVAALLTKTPRTLLQQISLGAQQEGHKRSGFRYLLQSTARDYTLSDTELARICCRDSTHLVRSTDSASRGQLLSSFCSSRESERSKQSPLSERALETSVDCFQVSPNNVLGPRTSFLPRSVLATPGILGTRHDRGALLAAVGSCCTIHRRNFCTSHRGRISLFLSGKIRSLAIPSLPNNTLILFTPLSPIFSLCVACSGRSSGSVSVCIAVIDYSSKATLRCIESLLRAYTNLCVCISICMVQSSDLSIEGNSPRSTVLPSPDRMTSKEEAATSMNANKTAEGGETTGDKKSPKEAEGGKDKTENKEYSEQEGGIMPNESKDSGEYPDAPQTYSHLTPQPQVVGQYPPYPSQVTPASPSPANGALTDAYGAAFLRPQSAGAFMPHSNPFGGQPSPLSPPRATTAAGAAMAGVPPNSPLFPRLSSGGGQPSNLHPSGFDRMGQQPPSPTLAYSAGAGYPTYTSSGSLQQSGSTDESQITPGGWMEVG